MRVEADVDGIRHIVQVERSENRLSVVLDGSPVAVDWRAMDGGFFYSMLIGGRVYEVTVEPDGESWRVQVGIEAHRVALLDPLRPHRTAEAGPAPRVAGGPTMVSALMPGKVVRILVKTGDQVAEGQDLLVVEAMKMENAVPSPVSGRVLELKVSSGETVEMGAPIVVIG